MRLVVLDYPTETTYRTVRNLLFYFVMHYSIIFSALAVVYTTLAIRFERKAIKALLKRFCSSLAVEVPKETVSLLLPKLEATISNTQEKSLFIRESEKSATKSLGLLLSGCVISLLFVTFINYIYDRSRAFMDAITTLQHNFSIIILSLYMEYIFFYYYVCRVIPCTALDILLRVEDRLRKKLKQS